MKLYFCVLALLVLQACTKSAPAQTSSEDAHSAAVASTGNKPSAQEIVLQAHGLSFRVPAQWHVEKHDGIYNIVAEAEKVENPPTLKVEAYRLQSAGGEYESAKQVLARIDKQLQGLSNKAVLLRQDSFEINAQQALRAEFSFEHQKAQFRRDQVLIERGDFVVVISYVAAEPHYSQNVAVWKALLQSLHVVDS